MVWADCREALRNEMADNTFALWIHPLIVEQQANILSLYTPNTYFTQHIKVKHLERIRALALEHSNGEITDVEVKYDPTYLESEAVE
jgi:chromosomal replication initiator protein